MPWRTRPYLYGNASSLSAVLRRRLEANEGLEASLGFRCDVETPVDTWSCTCYDCLCMGFAFYRTRRPVVLRGRGTVLGWVHVLRPPGTVIKSGNIELCS